MGLNPRRDSPYVMGFPIGSTIWALEARIDVAMAHSLWAWDIDEVYPLGPVPPTIGTAMSRIRKLNEQMRERAKVNERIVKKIDKSDLRIRMVGRDAMSLDGAVREWQADVSKVISMMESISLEFDRVRKESR
ncbi:hypothetical protein Tco_0177336 [Tanacetum coccineum]